MSRKDKLFMIANLKLPEILKTVKINDDDDKVRLYSPLPCKELLFGKLLIIFILG
jgi:hypothetical protein